MDSGKECGPCRCPVQPSPGSRCGTWCQPGLEGFRVGGRAALLAALQADQCVRGVWFLRPRAAMGSPGCGEWGFLCWALGQGTEGPPHGPSVDCPWGPGLGGTALEVSKWHPPRCRRVGREGAGRGGGWAPGLFCVGRLPLPVSAGWHGQQSVGVGTVQGPWLLPAGPGKGLPWGCLPRARPGLDQPLPWPTAVTVAAGEMRLSHGTRGQGLPAYVPTPDHQSCSWDPTLGFGPGNPPPLGWQPLGVLVQSSTFQTGESISTPCPAGICFLC